MIPSFLQPFKPKRNLHEQIVEELGLRIVRGQIKANDTLPNEDDLSVELGVSRTVTREAIKVLTEKGMLVSRPKTGTQIQPRPNWNLLDPDILHWEYVAGERDHMLRRLTEVRLIIEPSASELAAQRADADDLAAMEQAYQDMETHVEQIDRYIAADMRFHAAIVHASHNELLEQIINVIRGALIDSRLVTTRIPGGSKANLPHHFAVLDAIKKGQSVTAYHAMRALIIRTKNDIETVISEDLANSSEGI